MWRFVAKWPHCHTCMYNGLHNILLAVKGVLGVTLWAAAMQLEVLPIFRYEHGRGVPFINIWGHMVFSVACMVVVAVSVRKAFSVGW